MKRENEEKMMELEKIKNEDNQKIKQLETKNEQLETKNEQLETKNEQLETKNENLREENEEKSIFLNKMTLAHLILFQGRLPLHSATVKGLKLFLFRERDDYVHKNSFAVEKLNLKKMKNNISTAKKELTALSETMKKQKEERKKKEERN